MLLYLSFLTTSVFCSQGELLSVLLVTRGGRALQRVATVPVGARVHALWTDGTTGAATLVTECGACATATWDASARTVAVHTVHTLLPPPSRGHITAAALQPPLLAFVTAPERNHVFFSLVSSGASSSSTCSCCSVVIGAEDGNSSNGGSGSSTTVTVRQVRWVEHGAGSTDATATAAVLYTVAEGAEWALAIVAVDRGAGTATVVATCAVGHASVAVLAAPQAGGALVLSDRVATLYGALGDGRWGVRHACRVAGRAWTGAECALGHARHAFAAADTAGLHVISLRRGMTLRDGDVMTCSGEDGDESDSSPLQSLACATCLVPAGTPHTFFCGSTGDSLLLSVILPDSSDCLDDDSGGDDKEEEKKGKKQEEEESNKSNNSRGTIKVEALIASTAPVGAVVATEEGLVVCGGRGAGAHVARAASARRYTEDGSVALAQAATALWALPDAADPARDALLVVALAGGSTRALRLHAGTATPAAPAGLDAAQPTLLCAALGRDRAVQVTATGVRALGSTRAWSLPPDCAERFCAAAVAGTHVAVASTRGTVRVFALARDGAVVCAATRVVSGVPDGSLFASMALWNSGALTALIGTWDGRLLVVPVGEGAGDDTPPVVVGEGTARVTSVHVVEPGACGCRRARVLCGLADGTLAVFVATAAAASAVPVLAARGTLRLGHTPVHLAPEPRGRRRVLAACDAPFLIDGFLEEDEGEGDNNKGSTGPGVVGARVAGMAGVARAACVVRAPGFSAPGAADLCVVHADGVRLRVGHVAHAAAPVVARACALPGTPRAACRDAHSGLLAVACAHTDGTGSVHWLTAAGAPPGHLRTHAVFAAAHACSAVTALGDGRYAVGTHCTVLLVAVDAAAPGSAVHVLAHRDLPAPVTSLAVPPEGTSDAPPTLCATAGHHVVVFQIARNLSQQDEQQRDEQQRDKQEQQQETCILKMVDVGTTPFLAGEAAYAGRDTLVVRDVLRGLRVFRVGAGEGLVLVGATPGTLRLTALAPVGPAHSLAATLDGDLLCLVHGPRVSVVAALHVGELVTGISRAVPLEAPQQNTDSSGDGAVQEQQQQQGEQQQQQEQGSVLDMGRAEMATRLFYAGTASGRVLGVLAVTARDHVLLRALEDALAPAFACITGASHRAHAAPRVESSAGGGGSSALGMVDGDLVELVPGLAPRDAARLLQPLGDAAKDAAAFVPRIAGAVRRGSGA